MPMVAIIIGEGKQEAKQEGKEMKNTEQQSQVNSFAPPLETYRIETTAKRLWCCQRLLMGCMSKNPDDNITKKFTHVIRALLEADDSVQGGTETIRNKA